jgi:acetyl esterase
VSVIDPVVEAVLAEQLFEAPLQSMSPAELRAQMRTAIRACEGNWFVADRVDRVVDKVIQGEAGEVPVRIYSHTDAPPTAVIVYLHGGGWVAGDLDTIDKVARRLCVANGAVVVSVDYRLTPEHPFPAPFDDAWSVLLWTAESYPGLPVLVAGDSAGGTLAACVALKARDLGGPVLAGQVLIYPAVDDDTDTTSMQEFAGTYGASREDFAWYFGRYLGTAGSGHGYGMPGYADSLEGLAPAVMVIAGLDPLRDAEESYVERLQAAGVRVTVLRQPTLTHGWLDYFPRVPAAQTALGELIAAVRALVDHAVLAPV